MKIEIVDTIAGLERVEAEWLDLFRRSDERYLPQDPRVLRAFFASEGGRSHPLVVMLRERGQLVCVAPFFTWRGGFRFSASLVTLAEVPARMLKLASERMVYARDADREGCCVAALTAVRDYRDRYDFMVLPELTLPSTIVDVLHRAPWTALEIRGKRDRAYRHDLGESHEAFLASLSRKRRKNIRRDTKSWRTATFRRIERADEVEGFLTAVAAISRHSWQGQNFGMWSEARHASYLGYLQAFAEGGWLRSYLLEDASGAPMAFIMGWQGYGTLHYEEIGFDGRHRDAAPGIAATHLMMEDVYAHRPPRTVDFGYGDNRYKEVVANVTLETQPLHLFDRRRWRVAFATQRKIDALAEHARRVAAERGLEDRLRDLLKRRRPTVRPPPP
ncbi:MAG: GNAT family N-acetyltransferase [Myxococcota bacterium]